MTRGPGGAARRARDALRRWRRTRPFWGGLLLLLAGIDLLLVPLGSLFLHGPVKVVIYIGIGGAFGILIGALLIVCGLMLWVNPAHRTFYAVLGVLLALISFIATNLGGFFIGMLLGITGGSLAFGWVPGASVPPRPARPPEGGTGDSGEPPRSHRPGMPDRGTWLVLGLPLFSAGAPPDGSEVPVRRMTG